MVIGVDAGGTSIRALLAARDGSRLAAARGGGANPVSRGVAAAGDALAECLSEVLAGVDPAAVRRLMLGMAGGETFREELAATVDAVLRRLGLHCGWSLLSDLAVAFASGTGAPDGLLVLSGTGAAVGEIRDGALARHLDGSGWLLGDRGSGCWLGIEAARATVADIEGSGRRTGLTGEVCAAFGLSTPTRSERRGEADPARSLVTAVYRASPVSLSRLAPIVLAQAAGGDPVATGLLERAAGELLREAALLRADAPDLSYAVLAGGVLLAPGTLRTAVIAGLTDLGLRPADAGDGAAGAAWLAIRSLGPVIDPPTVHTRLTGR